MRDPSSTQVHYEKSDARVAAIFAYGIGLAAAGLAIHLAVACLFVGYELGVVARLHTPHE